jgi:hypothetical protein
VADDPLILAYRLGPALLSKRSRVRSDAVVQPHRSASGELWTLQHDSDGSTGTPVRRGGTAWLCGEELVVAGEAQRETAVVEISVGEDAHHIPAASDEKTWLLLVRAPRAEELVRVRQLDGDGGTLADNMIPIPREAPNASPPPRWWRRRHAWRNLRRLPAGHAAYAPLDRQETDRG